MTEISEEPEEVEGIGKRAWEAWDGNCIWHQQYEKAYGELKEKNTVLLKLIIEMRNLFFFHEFMSPYGLDPTVCAEEKCSVGDVG